MRTDARMHGTLLYVWGTQNRQAVVGPSATTGKYALSNLLELFPACRNNRPHCHKEADAMATYFSAPSMSRV